MQDCVQLSVVDWVECLHSLIHAKQKLCELGVDLVCSEPLVMGMVSFREALSVCWFTVCCTLTSVAPGSMSMPMRLPNAATSVRPGDHQKLRHATSGSYFFPRLSKKMRAPGAHPDASRIRQNW